MTPAGVPESKCNTSLLESPREHAEPVFDAPWQAAAFAMTLALHERGLFTWSEWTTCLSSTIQSARAAGDPDHGDTYYAHWLTALERLVLQKQWFTGDLLLHRQNAWQEAARHTAHGMPIELP
ncbi:nitrile hydratase accessory protein [Ralstonia soli]|uniref:Nitrile hydratase accessory protein n=1 Tax=Ralstonia soli TaxID=2953896 RepID=A0ABT1AIW9_9RALS|nr:nitrile hydratase accessory protein [Ralstonia soli]MCO5398238.1 nitrile hydratase accessory protein [Ralstonia soli]